MTRSSVERMQLLQQSTKSAASQLLEDEESVKQELWSANGGLEANLIEIDREA